MKKRILTLTMALALCLGLAAPAFAEEDEMNELPYGVWVDEEYRTVDISIDGPQVTAFLEGVELDRTPVEVKRDGRDDTSMLYRLRVEPNIRPVVGGEEGYTSGKLYVFVATYDAAAGTVSKENHDLIDALDITYDDHAVMPTYGEIMETAKKFEGNAVMFEADAGLFMLELNTGSTAPATPSAPAETTAPDAPGTYTAKKGDTWSIICTNFYGTNAQRYALKKANAGVTLKEGAVITLPEKLGKDTLIAAPVCAEGEKLYTVKAGDTLGKIALATYGSMSQYKAIYERNADRLKDANTIYADQVIVLPVISK